MGSLLLAILLAHHTPLSAAGQQIERFEAVRQAGERAYTAERFAEAETRYAELLLLAQEAKSPIWEAQALYGLGGVAARRGQTAAARETLDRALTLFRSAGDQPGIQRTAYALGLLDAGRGNATTAVRFWEEGAAAAAAVGDRRSEALNVFAIAREGDLAPERAFAVYTQAHQLAETAGDRLLAAGILHSWADHLFIAGDYDQAIGRLFAAAAAYEQLDRPNELGTVYNSLGRLYRAHGQYTAALEAQLTALKFHERTRTPRWFIQSVNAVAVTYQVLGDMDRARAYFERALILAEQGGLRSIVTFLRGNFGSFLLDIGETEQARILIEQAVADPGDFAVLRLNHLSRAYRELQRYDDALAAANRAVAACPQLSRPDCLYARTTRADALQAMGRRTEALSDLNTAVEGVERLRARLAPSDFLKQGFSPLWSSIYSQSIALHLGEGRAREALETTELARARALLDLLASRNLPVDADRRPVALPVRGRSSPALDARAVVRAPTFANLTAVAARLRTTMLLYWVAESSVHVWVLRPDGTVVARTTPVARHRLDRLVRALAPTPGEAPAQVRTRGSQQVPIVVRARPVWRELYNLLIAPIERELPRGSGARLTIVPHGPLFQVPFAALKDSRGRYLIERYSLHAVPSAALLQFTADRLRTDARSSGGLIVGDPAPLPRIAGDPPLARLPGASAEARAIARLLPGGRTTLLEAGAAAEDEVRASAMRRSILHFATHAIVRDGDPLASFLALAPGPGDRHDGQLTAQEIYGLELDADLVVLSACRSGGGAIGSDGVAALARAFIYAGAASLVVSVWDVVDAPTSVLLPAFYRAWLGGADKDRALRGAQLRLIADLRAGRIKVPSPLGELVLPEDPMFWAGVVLIGEPQ
jgi:CHAT domain-containing protein/tetratricopeptide (TPR) repeat protein